MTFEDQLEIIEQHMDEAFSRVLKILVTDRLLLEELAGDRHLDGFFQYGEQMWGYSSEKLREDIREELADALVYAAVLCSRLED